MIFLGIFCGVDLDNVASFLGPAAQIFDFFLEIIEILAEEVKPDLIDSAVVKFIKKV